jgi:diguanylate cyclase (GGDEF)-like protein
VLAPRADAAHSEPPAPRATEPVAAKIGTYLFLAGAAITAAGIVLPHPSEVDTGGYLAITAFSVLIAGVIWSRRGDTSGVTPSVIVVASIAVVSASLYFNGERHGGVAILNELYYVWPALYVGYFFKPRAIVFTLALIGAAYGVILHSIHVGADAGVTRWVITVSVTAGAAGALHVIRRYVNSLVRALREVARTDPLTGVLNRRGFDERLDIELRRARRRSEPLALIIGDIDDFKRLNDEFGHAAGDEALRRVADALRAGSREMDVIGRIGGEEFAMLMPATGLAGAYEAAERMRRLVESSDSERLTISFGAVELAGEHDDPAALIARADAALYDAKETGRNRTVVAPRVAARAPGD